jgi:DNA-nicking Smr family endonuclease
MAGMKDFGDLKSYRDRLKVEERLRAIEKAEREKRERAERENAVEFRTAVKGVNPMPESDRYVWRPAHEAELRRQAAARRPPTDDEVQAILAESMLSDQFDVDGLLDEEPTLSWAAPGVGPDVVKKLRKRHWPVEDEIDLHGLTRDLARRVVDAFLLSRRRTGAARHGPQLAGADRRDGCLLRRQPGRWWQRRLDRLAAAGAGRARALNPCCCACAGFVRSLHNTDSPQSTLTFPCVKICANCAN